MLIQKIPRFVTKQFIFKIVICLKMDKWRSDTKNKGRMNRISDSNESIFTILKEGELQD